MALSTADIKALGGPSLTGIVIGGNITTDRYR